MSRLAALVHRQSQADALEATRACALVVYTSIESVNGMPRLGPRPAKDGRICYVALLGNASSRWVRRTPAKLAGWTPIYVRRTPQSEGMSDRRFSRIGKLLPHMFFGNTTTTIFTDSKQSPSCISTRTPTALRTWLTAVLALQPSHTPTGAGGRRRMNGCIKRVAW